MKTAQPASGVHPVTPDHQEPQNHEIAFAEPPRKETGKKILEIKALSNAWVRVAPDAGRAEELMMAPGDIQIFTSSKGFSLQTGNAGGIRVRFDGREYPELGKLNQTLSLTFP